MASRDRLLQRSQNGQALFVTIDTNLCKSTLAIHLPKLAKSLLTFLENRTKDGAFLIQRQNLVNKIEIPATNATPC